MDVRRQLGLNIQRLRREKACSQEDLAFESGIHRTYISGLERGVRNPTITVVAKLAETFKVPIGTLLDPPVRKLRST
ncbi:MAG TPA: helix-turn-helix transcriptional regulator [Rhizomicrobium sp.]